MAEYKVFEDNIEALGGGVMAFLTDAAGKTYRENILKKHGIYPPDPEAWYDLQSFLNAFKELGDSIGGMTLFQIGKLVTEKAPFPPMKELEEALHSINVAYHMNHRKEGKPMFNPETGQMLSGIGEYKILKYDVDLKRAMIWSNSPYPSKFEEGIITQVARMFKPESSMRIAVKLDETKETRKSGAESNTYLISW